MRCAGRYSVILSPLLRQLTQTCRTPSRNCDCATGRGNEEKDSLKSFTPRLRVTLHVGNEFEGEMDEMVHEADTLSSLVAEQEATKTARKKFRFVEVVSVKPM